MAQYHFLTTATATAEELQRMRNILEDFFGTANDPEQIVIGKGTGKWIRENIPDCAIVIKQDNEIVGSTLIIPCTLEIMFDFVNGKINEAELGRAVQEQNITYEKMSAIYLCSAFVVEAHRHRHLAFQALQQSIRKLMSIHGKKVPLFYWGYSEAGSKISEKLAEFFGVSLYVRK